MNGEYLFEWGELAKLWLVYLVVAFAIQPQKWKAHKEQFIWTSPWLYGQAILMGILAGVAQGDWTSGKAFIVMPIVAISHLLLEGLRLMAEKRLGERSIIFVPAFLLHLLLFVGIWADEIDHSQEILESGLAFAAQPKVWLIALGYVIVWFPTGYLMRLITLPWQEELSDSPKGLAQAGRWIGILERTLVLTFILNNAISAIGLLIAAKSILRFGEIKDHENRKEAEYILIGTLLSFSIAIILGLWIRSVIVGEHLPVDAGKGLKLG